MAATPAYGLIALAALGACIVVAARRLGVKVRMLSHRWLGIRVYDFGADVTLPTPPRSYQIALYLTMKSMPREPAKLKSPPVVSR